MKTIIKKFFSKANKYVLHAREEKIVECLRRSNLFQEKYYLDTYGEIAPFKSAIEHFVAVGQDRYFDPSPYFSTSYYLSHNPDVKKAGLNCLYHYIQHGESEGRNPNPLFSPNDYLELNPDLEVWNKTLLAHFIEFGHKEQRYARKVVNHKMEQIESGKIQSHSELLHPTEFDNEYYLETNKDVYAAGVDPYHHYFSSGESEGRCPNKFFDPLFYSEINSDIRTQKISPFKHFQDHGYYEGRLGLKPQQICRSSSIKPILFVGHDGVQAGSEVVLLEVLKWFYFHTERKLKVLLLNPGPVANQYAKYADIYVLSDSIVDEKDKFKKFVSDDFEFIYINTVVSGKLFEILDIESISLTGDIVTHIHEMDKVLNEWDAEMQCILKHTDLYISASPASTQTLVNNYDINRDIVTTVPAFINPVVKESENNLQLKKDVRDSLGLSSNSFVIAGCGTVYWRKGTDIFVETAKILKERTDKKIEFVWIGDGPDRDQLESQLSDEEKKYIKFVGNHNNANELLAAADVFFLSSREDPFPLVVLESAQHSIPSVCFKEATGITEFVKHNSGLIIDDISSLEAAKKIILYIENNDLLLEHGHYAKQQVFKCYTSDIQNKKIFKAIYNKTSYLPALSVIIPFYNHEDYLKERIDSILNQTNQDFEIIALDDYSSDNSIEVVSRYHDEYRLDLYKNTSNSGSPFKQWKKGLESAKGQFVWIAEGDDTASPDFIRTLFVHFNDSMVNIVSAKTEIIGSNGEIITDALKPYFERAYPEKFSKNYKKDGCVEVNEQLGSICTLVNASGLLIRKSALSFEILNQASKFKMAGDWLIYLSCLKHGKIVHEVNATNYFRRHESSQVHKVEGTEIYFKERFKILEYVQKNYPVYKLTLRRAIKVIESEWDRFKHKHPQKNLSDLVDFSKLVDKSKVRECMPHVALYVHGMTFSKGGIERLAAQLSNHLIESGYEVTIYCRLSETNESIYPVYESVAIVPIFDEKDLAGSIPRLRKSLLDLKIDVFVPMLSEWLFEPVIESAQGTGIPIIASEHNDPWKIEELWWEHEKRKSCFAKVDKIHLLLDKFKQSLPTHLEDKIEVIPNGVKFQSGINNNKKENLIIAVGRLAPQKRFDRLIKAIDYIKNELREKSFTLEVYGEGELKNELNHLIDELEISDLISLKGNSSDMDSVYRRAKMMVMPSEFEGFGIALIEALSYGLPSIAFRECNGPNEIIEPDVSGYLVEDIEQLSERIIDLTNKSLPISIGTYRLNDTPYSMDNFYRKWKSLILSCNE